MDSTTSTLAAPAGLFNGLSASDVFCGTIASAAVVRETMPRHYRLRKSPEGEFVLQGGYLNTRGWNESWLEWEDLETINE